MPPSETSAQSERYEVEIEKLPVALFGGYLVVRYEWKLWVLDEEGRRKYRPSLADPLKAYGQSFTKWGARRDARRVLRKSDAYYSQDREVVQL
jgi:hypothetical protein